MLNLQEVEHSQIQIQVGMNIKSSHAAPRDSMKSTIIVFNVSLQMFSTQSIKDVDHVQQIISMMIQLNLVSAKFLVQHQEYSMEKVVNVQLMEKVSQEYGIQQINPVIVQAIFHFGMVNIV
jgi:hypothetical protein